MAATEEAWMPREVHNYDRGSIFRYDVEWCWGRSLGIVQCYKWGQARLCSSPTLFSIILSTMLDEAFRYMGDGVYIQSR